MNILLNEKVTNAVEVLIEKFRKGLITFEEYLKALRKRFLKHQHNVLQERIIVHRKEADKILEAGMARLELTRKELEDAHFARVDKRVEMIKRKRNLWYKY